ncbi:MAG: acetyl-CoA C-acyltransferase [Gordonia sp.]|nr:acetyl-CoA C-acyltransferase [Gordonia sp. (in: high G+C Gram-positive bacteria)]
MTKAVIVGAARTPVATARRGSLSETPVEVLAAHAIEAAVKRSGLDGQMFDDVIFAESQQGGADIARHAAVKIGLAGVPGQAVNRYCAGSLTAVGNASATIMAGMDSAVIAGGAHSASLAPALTWRTPGGTDTYQGYMPTFPYTEDANDDVTLSTGWNVAQAYDLSREEMDAWAFRSHQRAVAAIDAGVFDEEIVPLKVTRTDGTVVEFAVDEHPRRGSTLEKLASLKPLHPEIEGFSITAGNAAGVNDGASALAIVADDVARSERLEAIATVRGWAATGVSPRVTGLGAIEVIRKLLARMSLLPEDIHYWEINEAFAAVPLAACRAFGLDESLVNMHGSGCSIGHPIAATGGRMVMTLAGDLKRRGGGLGVAAMCAGGGQGGAVLIEVG